MIGEYLKMNKMTEKKPFRIFLSSLEYDTVYTIMTVPINIGYIASYLNQKFGDNVDIKLFKYPKKLEKAIDKNPPDMLCMGNYSWNARLNEVFLNKVKRLNPETITVMGGPNIRRKPDGIHNFLKNHPSLDYYVMDYGEEAEESLGRLVGEILNKIKDPHPTGCATIIDGKFYFEAKNWSIESKTIKLPSPYLSGYLDEFLKDPKLIPTIESTRGCPYSCTYCVYGDKTYSKLRTRTLKEVYKDIDYVIKKSAGQKNWIITDPNFGLFEKDVQIVKRLRKVMDENGYPYEALIYDPKDMSSRSIEIYKIFGGQNRPLIAIQTADPKVSVACGRGNTDFKAMKEKVDCFHKMGIEVKTDIILGLPEESAKSHLYSLKEVFNMGFDWCVPKELRLIQGSVYEEQREKYKIKTKFRPIYGAYGIYDNKPVFELDESVRETKDMTEEEMSNFKVHHFLMTFMWSSGLFVPILKLGQKNSVNPMTIMDQLNKTKKPILKNLFDNIRTGIRREHFDTAEAMINHYEKPENFNKLVNGFYKLTYYYTALLYKERELFESLKKETIDLLTNELKKSNKYDSVIFNDMVKLTERLICKNLLSEEFRTSEKHFGKTLNILNLTDDENLMKKEFVDVEVYRPKEVVSFCKAELIIDGKKDLSMHNLTRFFERKGLELLSNKMSYNK